MRLIPWSQTYMFTWNGLFAPSYNSLSKNKIVVKQSTLVTSSTLENNFSSNFLGLRKTRARANQVSRESFIVLNKLVFDGIFSNLEIIPFIIGSIASPFEDWLFFGENSSMAASFSFCPIITILNVIISSKKKMFLENIL